MTLLPKVIFGTSSLGNLYSVLDDQIKYEIIEQIVSRTELAVFDTAGKYGAGLALEVLGNGLDRIDVQSENVVISNKLGWLQVPLLEAEPTFEKGVWFGLDRDAVQKISYEGILECFEQGNSLLGRYDASMVSVHDPDEYLSASSDAADYNLRYKDILDAYRGLYELKTAGKVNSVGVGAKNWKVIEKISKDIELDWVMFANSLTLHSHPRELMKFIADLAERGTQVINSAVFNGGFLIGGDYYNYLPVDPGASSGRSLIEWRRAFFKCCEDFGILPAEACFEFGIKFPGISSIALNTSKPENIAKNIDMASVRLPDDFWNALYHQKLIAVKV
ncbi:aldo/keto reductase [Pedobacter sp. GR22-6]|uniref:aldo/keto reductase n=1 Tax=Pedobacter sp. GR22-6 TaxID=3127957 RepID=UPI00307E8DD2